MVMWDPVANRVKKAYKMSKIVVLEASPQEDGVELDQAQLTLVDMPGITAVYVDR